MCGHAKEEKSKNIRPMFIEWSDRRREYYINRQKSTYKSNIKYKKEKSHILVTFTEYFSRFLLLNLDLFFFLLIYFSLSLSA